MASGYTVTGPLAIVQDEGGHQVYVYQGAPLPDFVSKERAEALVVDGLVSSDDDPKTPAAKKAAAKKAAADADADAADAADAGESKAATKKTAAKAADSK